MKYRLIPFALLLSVLFAGCAKEESKQAAQITASTQTTKAATAPQSTTTAATTEATIAATELPKPVHNEPPADLLLLVDQTIKVYEVMTISEMLCGFNGQLEQPDALVDTNEIGTFETTIRYTFADELYEHPVSYTVKDTTPPLLLNSGYDAQITVGKEFRLTEHVGVADNYDRAPVLTSWGTVDTAVCGSYPVKAVAADASGNSISWDLTVQVVEREHDTPKNAPQLSFDQLRERYAADNVHFGIDVSRWQANIDFNAVRDAGCEFVLMRMGYYYDTMKMDEYYRTNMEKARAAGLDVGIYIYTTANTEEEVRSNAQWIAQQLDGQELDFPVIFDWESFSNFQKYGMSIHDLNMLFEVFADEMAKHGYPVMLYGSRNLLQEFWYPQTEHPVWLAHYTEETDYEGDYALWQMTDRGSIAGITGNVDFNILYADRMEAFTNDETNCT